MVGQEILDLVPTPVADELNGLVDWVEENKFSIRHSIISCVILALPPEMTIDFPHRAQIFPKN